MISFFASLINGQISFESSGCNTATVGSITLLSQGVLAGKTLDAILADYQRTGDLNVDGCEGSFILALVDREKQTAVLYRHIVGSHYVYYAGIPEVNIPGSLCGFTFGSNLAELVKRNENHTDANGSLRKVNESKLPVLFLYRMIPGRETLFDGVFKLMPGEMVQWKVKDNSPLVTQHRSMPFFDETHKMNETEAIDRTEAVLKELLAEWYATEPQSTVLLSGGVDSTLLQVHWNPIWKGGTSPAANKPPSACVVLNHPYTKPDLEYTLTAVQELGTEHTNIPQEPLTADFMREILAKTGEMPSHVQSFYFATLAKGLNELGWKAAIAGEGADGMFGNGCPDDIITAKMFQKKYPSPLLRSVLAGVFDVLKPDNYRSPRLRLANHLDDLNYPQHPQNAAAAFTNFDTIDVMFGRSAMLNAMQYRRTILDHLEIPQDELLRPQLINIFGEGIETAAYWTSMLHLYDVEMVNPFQDSRLIRVASNITPSARFVHGNPKQVLKKALGRHVPAEFMNRPKLGFGQPVFEWLSPGGTLYDAVQDIGDYAWLDKKLKEKIIAKPDWILWTLLCFDLWYKSFFR